MRIVQFSDPHVTLDQPAYGRVHTLAMLDQAVRASNGLALSPDLVIGSGDLAQNGTAEEYAALRGILRTLKAPFAPVMGNHDRRLAFRHAFADFGHDFGPAPFVQYALDVGEIRVLVLDTVQEGSEHPTFCEVRGAWLEQQLALSDRPTLIAMHHPPFPTGIGWMDPPDPNWSLPIARAIAGKPWVKRIVCGHVHRGISGLWHGVPASTVASTAHQVFPALAPDARPLLSFEAPGFDLHQWDGEQFWTYRIAVDGLFDTFPPGADMPPRSDATDGRA